MITAFGDILDKSHSETNEPISNYDFDAKATWRRRLVGLKVRAAAMRRRFNSAVGSDVFKNT